jgi:glycosyltransferase involved in cell wall biosynthesis
MTDPPYLLYSVLHLRKRFGGRVIHHVDDLYPDLAFALGALPDLAFFRRWLEGPAVCALKSSDRVVALGYFMKRRLAEKGVAANRIHVVPPWADGRALFPVPPAANSWRRRFVGNRTDFVVMYSGNMGRAHPFSSIIEAARYFSRRRGVRFLFVGGGARRGAVEALLGAGTGVTLLPYQPRRLLPKSLSAGDVHLISLDPAVQGMIVPSKLAGILAVGRPVIFLGGRKNSVAEAIRAGGFGYVLAETDHEGLKTAILRLQGDPALHRRMCENARHFFHRNYERAFLTEKLTAVLENRWRCR